MNIAMIGTGYVGLVSGACFSEFGLKVTCLDKDQNKIDALNDGQIPIYEPGLDDLVTRNASAGRLQFTNDLATAVSDADVIFIAVGTPTRRGDGHADLTYVYEVAKEIAPYLDEYKLVVTKSTVTVGTGRKVSEIIRKTNPDAQFSMCSNPEFLREGSAIDDFMRPDRIVIGIDDERAEEIMRRIYRPLYLREAPLVFTSLETAELAKYAANAFLATKITFINEVADLCEKFDADVQDIARAMGLDGRIGPKFLHPGPGYGGSCFPKDTLALTQTAREVNAPISIVESVVSANENRKVRMAEKIKEICHNDLQEKKLAVLGLTFKPNTDDMRDAPSLVIIPKLQQAGANITAYDPVGIEQAKKHLNDVTWTSDPYQALEDADAVVILTEWNEFRALDLDRIKQLMKTPLMIDLRNIYKLKDMKGAGFDYHSVGRPSILIQQEQTDDRISPFPSHGTA